MPADARLATPEPVRGWTRVVPVVCALAAALWLGTHADVSAGPHGAWSPILGWLETLDLRVALLLIALAGATALVGAHGLVRVASLRGQTPLAWIAIIVWTSLALGMPAWANAIAAGDRSLLLAWLAAVSLLCAVDVGAGETGAWSAVVGTVAAGIWLALSVSGLPMTLVWLALLAKRFHSGAWWVRRALTAGALAFAAVRAAGVWMGDTWIPTAWHWQAPPSALIVASSLGLVTAWLRPSSRWFALAAVAIALPEVFRGAPTPALGLYLLAATAPLAGASLTSWRIAQQIVVACLGLLLALTVILTR